MDRVSPSALAHGKVGVPQTLRVWALPSFFASNLRVAATYLPTSVTEPWTQARSWATATLQTPVAHTAALTGSPEKPILLVVTADGYLCAWRPL